MGRERSDAHSFTIGSDENFALEVMKTNVEISEVISKQNYDLVHSHTWYANFAGQLSSLSLGIPHVMTAHSLEPMRPWKREQLGSGYEISSQIEKQAFETASKIIAVSHGMKTDIETEYPDVNPRKIEVIHNGIDPAVYKPTYDPTVLTKYGVELDKPIVLFVGRITRQKGLPHLLASFKDINPASQCVLVASSPDDAQIQQEVQDRIAELRTSNRQNIVWIDSHVPLHELLVLYTAATVFVCPSIYEPLGIVNLEAMACETAVVASSVGGIPEVVSDRVTGLLVDYDPHKTDEFERNLALRINEVLEDASLAREMGRRAREHVTNNFDWKRIAQNTIELYESLVNR
jgi:starch synthase